MKSMDMSHTVQISGARGTKILKATGLDNETKVPGVDMKSQLKGSGFGGGRDNLSHSITSGSVPGSK